ncbi:MAG: hypothetical protein M5U22_14110 [Thermoleophilia bacterium]|nr:hypothetical protein [Thermoleophilia bacterium]
MDDEQLGMGYEHNPYWRLEALLTAIVERDWTKDRKHHRDPTSPIAWKGRFIFEDVLERDQARELCNKLEATLKEWDERIASGKGF